MRGGFLRVVASAGLVAATQSVSAPPYDPGQSVLLPDAKRIVDAIRPGYYSRTVTAGSALVGSLEAPNAGNRLLLEGLGYTHTVCIPNLVGGCLYSHDYGVSLDLEFATSGTISYAYEVPYSVELSFPMTVYPGQRLLLSPSVAWKPGARITVKQRMDFEHSARTRADAPGDGLDDLALAFSQYADKARLQLAIPVVPGLPTPPPLDVPVGFPPFNEGGGSFGGSYTKLGGTATLDNTGDIVFNSSERGVSVGASPSTAYAPLWRQGHEQFALVSSVLTYIPTPATVAAGVALKTVRELGQFRLDTYIEGGARRTDVVAVEFDAAPVVIDVPATLEPGSDWSFTDLAVPLAYGVRTYSYTEFPISMKLTFDMLGISPQVIAEVTLEQFPAGTQLSPWQQATSTVKVSGRLPVVARQEARWPLQQFALEPIARQPQEPKPAAAFSLPQQLAPRPAPTLLAPIKLVTQVAPPKPDRRAAIPRVGEFGVVLASVPTRDAPRLQQWFRNRGVDAYVASIGTSDSVVGFGVHRSREDAERAASLLRLAFDLPITVQVGGQSGRPPALEGRFRSRLAED